MEVHDLRGEYTPEHRQQLDRLSNRFRARTHHIHAKENMAGINDEDIEKSLDLARKENAEMVLILNYGIQRYIPNSLRG